MSTYTKSTNFLAKDSLPLNNAAKYVKGSELDAEFNNLATADADNLKISALGTGVETALGVNVGSAGAPVLFDGAGGTPTSLVGTNITGTAAGLTAGAVTTNANLTGHVTSVGNAAVLGSFTHAQLNTAVSDANLAASGANTDITSLTALGAGTAALPSIAPSGDPNTGIWFPAADTMAVATGGTERMRIDTSGNVGVGVAPAYPLDVLTSAGRIAVTASGAANRITSVNTANAATVDFEINALSHTLKIGGTSTLVVDTSGNVTQNFAAGLGYGTGAGGTVTQATSRATAVTINKPCGAITLFTAAGNSAWSGFAVNNSLVAKDDTVEISVQTSGATNVYHATVAGVQAGVFTIYFQSISGTNTDTPVFNFKVLKGVAS